MLRLCFVLVFISFNTYSQDVPIIKFHDLEKILASKQHEVQILNFWATWCAPCVAELPLLEKVPDDEANVVLINLDFADKLDRVKSFVARKGINKQVLLLDEIDYNSWIDQVDKSWSGAIPATLFINTKTGKRKFVGKELEEGEIQKILSELNQ
jgi:thiol-disulfide isomerase/thioredoxin